MERRKELDQLNILVGTWEVSGENISGTITYEWMEGKFFLLQKIELLQYGNQIKGFEVIGYRNGFMQEVESESITSTYYDTVGNTFDYTYEVTEDSLTIWGGEKGSPAYYKGKWNEAFTINAGAWVYPGGGGYDSTMKKVDVEL